MEKLSILKKIKRLLALGDAERNSSAEEAALAVEKAQELLFKHNLEISQVHGLKEDEIEAIGMQVYDPKYGIDNWKWKSYLLEGICDVSLCQVVHSQKEVSFFGRPSNVKIAIYLFEYLVREIGKIELPKPPQRSDIDLLMETLGEQTSFETNFYIGVVETVRRRLQEKFKKDQEAKGGKELVVVNTTDISKMVNEAFPNIKPTRIRAGGEGMDVGRDVGRGIPINDALERKGGTNVARQLED